MNTYTAHFRLLFFLLLTSVASAQYIRVDDTYTAQQLIQNVLLNNQCAAVSNISVSGGNFASGSQSYGYFNGNGSTFTFQDGVILSTGRAVRAVGPNTSLLDDGNNMDWNGDTDLEQALDINNSTNATVLEFDFVPLASHISFKYMLSSEEYHDDAPCRYSDGFAFLLREAGTTNPYINLAVIPGSTIPVKVTSVHPRINTPNGCEEQNEEYFGAFNGREHPTNFNGQTKVMTAEATVVPGTSYHIKLVIADETNYRYDSAIFLGGGSFNASTYLGPDRLFATNNPLCNGEAFPMDGTTATATAYQWYKDNIAITGATNPVYVARDSGTYTVDVKFTSTCSAKGSVKLEYAAPLTFSTYTLLQCDDDADGLTAYNLAAAGELAKNGDTTLQADAYFTTLADAQANTNAITVINPYYNTIPNQPVYIRIQNQYGCSAIATVNLSTSNNTVTNPAPHGECDVDGTDDGFYSFNLNTLFDNQILAGLPAGTQVIYYPAYNDALTFSNAITNPQTYANTTAYTQNIYARVSQGSDCYGIATVQILVYSFGTSLKNENVTLCEGSDITLDGGSFSTYSWDTTPIQTTRQITVSTPGTYTVTVTNAQGCSGSKTFTVSLSGAATGAIVDITDFKGGDNSFIIMPQGAGMYEYSIDGINYQAENTFTSLETGEYFIYIRDINGCSPVYRKRVYVLDYPKFFTPNGDGKNETWRIPYLSSRPGANVIIYDRFGKLITSFYGNAPGWDGTLNGYRLPATDYWFVINLENGRVVRGHFALIR